MTNFQCAVNAELALDAYTRITYGGRAWDELHPDDRSAALSDLLSDLMHLAKRFDLDFDWELGRAERHFEYECNFGFEEEHA